MGERMERVRCKDAARELNMDVECLQYMLRKERLPIGFKKVAMWLMVIVGMMVDEMLMYASSSIGKEWPFKFVVGCAVAIWLICNEIISILENIQDIGVNIPPFLKPIVKRIRSQVEEEMEESYVEEKGDEENED